MSGNQNSDKQTTSTEIRDEGEEEMSDENDSPERDQIDGSTNTQEVGELDDDNRPASNQESEDEDSQDITRSHSSAYQLRRHPRPSRKEREAQARV